MKSVSDIINNYQNVLLHSDLIIAVVNKETSINDLKSLLSVVKESETFTKNPFIYEKIYNAVNERISLLSSKNIFKKTDEQEETSERKFTNIYTNKDFLKYLTLLELNEYIPDKEKENIHTYGNNLLGLYFTKRISNYDEQFQILLNYISYLRNNPTSTEEEKALVKRFDELNKPTNEGGKSLTKSNISSGIADSILLLCIVIMVGVILAVALLI